MFRWVSKTELELRCANCRTQRCAVSFYSIYTIFSQICFCRDLRLFCVNFQGPKLRSRNFFWQISYLATASLFIYHNSKTKPRSHQLVIGQYGRAWKVRWGNLLLSNGKSWEIRERRKDAMAKPGDPGHTFSPHVVQQTYGVCLVTCFLCACIVSVAAVGY